MKIAILQVLLLSKICLGKIKNSSVQLDETQDESTLENASLTRFDAVSSMLSSLNFILNKMIISRQQNQDIPTFVEYSNRLHSNSIQQPSPCSTNSQDLVHSNLRGSMIIVSRPQVSPNMRQHDKENIQLDGFYDSSSGSSSESSSGSAAYGDYAGYYYGYYGDGDYADYGYYYDYEGSGAEEDAVEGGDENETSTSVSVQSDVGADVTDSVIEDSVIATESEIAPMAPLSSSHHSMEEQPARQQHRVFAPEQQTRLRKAHVPEEVFVQKVTEVQPRHTVRSQESSRGLADALDKELKRETKAAAKVEKLALKAEVKEGKSVDQESKAQQQELKSAEKVAKSDVKAEKVASKAVKKASKTFQQDVHPEEQKQ